MTTLVFGHKSPDTDSTGSPLIWAWYLSAIKDTPAEAKLLGEPNTEAVFMLDRWEAGRRSGNQGSDRHHRAAARLHRDDHA